jgi:hypothetical protein
MSLHEVLAIVALTAYALYRQSVAHRVVGRTRFKLPFIYCAVGLVAGGFQWPPGPVAWMVLLGGLLLSAVTGVARGRLSKLWLDPLGQPMVRGTPLTVALFLLLIAAKVAMGAWQAMTHQPAAHGGFGEVLLLIGVMAALQAEIVWRRASRLASDPASHAPALLLARPLR